MRAGKRRKQADGPGPLLSSVSPSADWELEDMLSWEQQFGNFNLTRFGEDSRVTPPSKIAPGKHLKRDLRALHDLTDRQRPPRRKARLGKPARAIYGFEDAIKDGFVASIEVEGVGMVWRSGVWNLSIREESSNFREFRNLDESIEHFVAAGTPSGHELFMFTDNSTAEAAFSKGLHQARSALIWFFD
jgi:hypothetical protein